MLNSIGSQAFLTLEEAAALLQVSKRTIQRLVRRREMPGLKVGGQWRIPQGLFLTWIEERTVANSQTAARHQTS